MHFHCIVVEGAFFADATGGAQFHEARGLGAEALAKFKATVRTRLLRALSRRNLLEREDAQAMGEWDTAGTSSSIPACASRKKTMPAWNACCATAPDYEFDQRIAW